MTRRLSVLASGILLAAGCNALLGLDDPRIIDSDASEAAAPASDAGDEGCAAALSDDPRNCGACGHDCLGGACLDGGCQPVVLAKGQDTPFAIAVGSTQVAWVNFAEDGSVMHVPIEGGAVETIAPGQSRSMTIAIADPFAYWGTGDGFVRRTSVTATTPTEFIAGPGDGVGAIAVDGKMVYWTGSSEGIFERSVNGGPVNPLVGGEPVPQGLGLSPSAAYWVSVGSLRWAPRDGGPPATLVTGSGNCGSSGVVTDANNVYWTDTCSGGINAIPLTGGASRTLGMAKEPYGLAVDARFVYWTDQNPGHRGIYRAPVAGGQTEIILSDQPSFPWAIAVDDKAIYWTNRADGTIAKIAKP